MTALRQTLRTVADLSDAGLLPPDRAREAEAVAARYAVAVTPAVAELIDRHDAADPIAGQFLPDITRVRTDCRTSWPTRSPTSRRARSPAWCIATPIACY